MTFITVFTLIKNPFCIEIKVKMNNTVQSEQNVYILNDYLQISSMTVNGAEKLYM